MTEINFNNLPEAVGLLIQKVENLVSLMQTKQAPEKVEFDRIKIEEASNITGYGKSKMYKLTSENKIPHKLMGNRLIFSRKELLEWLDSKTVEPVSGNNNVLNVIAESAAKKERTAR